MILAGAIATNFLLDKPFVGVWAAILLGAFLRKPAWGELPGAAKGAVFLLSLVWCASLMPVKALPPASWQTAFGLGLRVGRVRQHPADEAGPRAGRLRLGRARVHASASAAR